MKIRLRNVLYAPNMGCTLISISQIDQAGYSVAFQNGKCVIRNQRNQIMAQIPRSNGLYRVEETSFYALSAETLTLDELHQRHGHVAVMNWHFSRSFRLIFLNTYGHYLSRSQLNNLTTFVSNHFAYSLCSQITRKHVY